MYKVIEKTLLIEKIENIYNKLCAKKNKLIVTSSEEKKQKYQEKIDKLLSKLVKKKIKLYKHEIINAKKLKQNGILIPLAPHNEGAVFTDEVKDFDDLKELALINNWKHKCLWIDLKNDEKQYIIYLNNADKCE